MVKTVRFIYMTDSENENTKLQNNILKIKLVDPEFNPIMPQKNGDWIDIAIPNDVTIEKDDFKLIDLGFAAKIPIGYEAHVLPRSSTFMKYGILMANSMGIIDNTYSGDSDIWKFPAYALKNTHIEKGTRIAQFRLVKTMDSDFIDTAEVLDPRYIYVVNHLDDTDRGGFGSTGN